METRAKTSSELQRRLGLTALGTGAATFLIGLLSYLIDSGGADLSHWALVLFNLAGLVILDAPEPPYPAHWLFGLARLGGVITAATGVAFVVVSLARDSVERRRLSQFQRAVREGKRHAVVCGLGRVGERLVRDLLGPAGPGGHVAIIEADAANPHIEACRELGAIIIIGDARQRTVREHAVIHRAEEVFVVTGSDAVNLDIAEDIRADLEARGAGERTSALNCYTNILSHTLAQAAEAGLPSQEPMAFRVFNTHASAARQLLLHPDWGLARTAAAGQPARVPTSSDEVAYYIVFGFGAVGQSVALQMARLAHFPNLKRLRLTLVDRFDDDPRVLRARDEFIDRHPGFCPKGLDLEVHVTGPEDPDAWSNRRARPAHADWRTEDERVVEYAVNAEFLPLSSGVEDPDLLARLIRRIRPPRHARPVVAVVVCFDTDEENFEAALRLEAALDQLLIDGILDRPFPVYAFTPDEEGLERLLEQKRTQTGFSIRPFGRKVSVANREQITRHELRTMAEEAHRCFAKDSPATPPWDSLTPALKASSEDAAAHGDIKLDALGWTRRRLRAGETPPDPGVPADRIDLLAQVEHNRWMGERLSAGWRYGEPVRSPGDGNRRRLSFCAWQHLTDREERAKDESHVHALASMYGAAGYAVESGSKRNDDPAR